MTEVEWLKSISLQSMVSQLDYYRLDRKLRLFAVASCRRAWSSIEDPKLRSLVKTSELYADGLVSQSDLADAHQSTLGGPWSPLRSAVQSCAAIACASWYASAQQYTSCAAEIAHILVPETPDNERTARVQFARESALRDMAILLREIVGNPFRPATFDPRWRTSDVVGLARAIYDDKAFERMPILADALMDAGCEDEQIIGHCRADGPHVRGCWVVDLILGKE